MKKALIIISIFIVLVLGAVVTLPMIFRDALLETARTTVYKHLGVNIGFSEFRLSFIRNFPKATLRMGNVYVTGARHFQNDTLLKIPVIRADMDLLSLFSKEGVSLEELSIESPVLRLRVGEDSVANWDFYTDSKPTGKTGDIADDAEEKVFQLELENVVVTGADVSYLDQSTGIAIYFNGSNATLSGNMYGSSFDMEIWGKVNDFRLLYDSLVYVAHTTLETNSLLTIDYETMEFRVSENEFRVNRLPLVVEGNVKMPGDSVVFDLDIGSVVSGLDEFLDLVPPDYAKYLDGMTATGKASISGALKGVYVGDQYPAFHFTLSVDEGSIKYDGLPEELKHVNAEFILDKPQGPLDGMELRITQGHTEIRDNPVDLVLSIKNLFRDPFFNGKLNGKVNFSHLKDALPLDSMHLTGEMEAFLTLKAPYSAIREEQYDFVEADGTVQLTGFSYAGPRLTMPVVIPAGQLQFSPSWVELTDTEVRIGQSDMQLSGKISNYLGYLLKGGTLDGTLGLRSQFLNLNELIHLMADKESGTDTPAISPQAGTDEPETIAFDIPQNLNLEFTSRVSNVLLGRLPFTGVNGLITAKDGKLVLHGLQSNLFEGGITLIGSYMNNPEKEPEFDLSFDVSEIDLPTASRNLLFLEKAIPSDTRSRGKVSTRFSARGRFSPELKIISSTVNGSGTFTTHDIQIIDSPTFQQLQSILKQEKLRNITVDDVTAQFQVENGNLFIKPFQTQIAGQQATITGSLNAKDILNLQMDFVIERSAFGPDIQEILEVIPGQENIQSVPVTVLLRGPVEKPEVTMNYTETRKYIMEKIKNATPESLKKSIDRIGDALKKWIEK